MKKHSNTEPALGVDIGRVIIAGDGPDTNFIGGGDDQAMRAPAMPMAFEALARLNQLYGGRVWLVSKCGPRIQERSRAWLRRHRFFETTKIPFGHLRFCRERRDKALICAELGIQCFVDDRADVLTAMQGIVRYRLMFGATVGPAPSILGVPTWREAEEAATASYDALLSARGKPEARAR